MELSKEEQLRVAAKLLGYSSMPPTIRQFVEDPYYLGDCIKVYPYWMEVLEKVYPDPIHIKYPIVISTGAIGTGKSTLSKVMALYNLCKLQHLDNVDFFGISLTKPFDFMFFHTSVGKAQTDFIESINMMKGESPYFAKMKAKGQKIPVNMKADGARSNNAIGGDVIFYNLSELNFVKPAVAEYKIEQALKRYESRFRKILGYFGNVIIDTSSRGDESIVENFMKSNPFAKYTLVTRTAIWDAKKHLNIYFNEGHFYVYSGDSLNKPQILPDDYKLSPTMDAERVIKAPMELKPHFIKNVIEALQDQAGISTKSTGRFLNDTEPFLNCLTIPLVQDEVIKVNFSDPSDKIIDYLTHQLNYLDRQRKLYIRFDIGLVKDLCGIAISQFDGYKTQENSDLQLPVIRTPILFGLSRHRGEETSISHLLDFVLDLIRMGFEIGEVTTDQFQSSQLRQDLTRYGIKCALLSVDRTDTAYVLFKNLIATGTWSGVKSQRFIKEIVNLNHVDGKVDHDSEHEKDISDAVSGSIQSLYNNMKDASDPTSHFKVDNQLEIIRKMQENKLNQFQEMFNSIYKSE